MKLLLGLMLTFVGFAHADPRFEGTWILVGAGCNGVMKYKDVPPLYLKFEASRMSASPDLSADKWIDYIVVVNKIVMTKPEGDRVASYSFESGDLLLDLGDAPKCAHNIGRFTR